MIYMTPQWAAEMTAQIREAKSSIILSALSMHPPKTNSTAPHCQLMQELATAGKRGVQVKIYLAAPAAHTPAAARNLAARQWLLESGCQVKLIAGSRLLHAKSLIVDAASLWIGSGNFTPAAMHFNHEVYLNFINEDTAKVWATYLECIP